jgi:hypothetical protein
MKDTDLRPGDLVEIVSTGIYHRKRARVLRVGFDLVWVKLLLDGASIETRYHPEELRRLVLSDLVAELPPAQPGEEEGDDLRGHREAVERGERSWRPGDRPWEAPE